MAALKKIFNTHYNGFMELTKKFRNVEKLNKKYTGKIKRPIDKGNRKIFNLIPILGKHVNIIGKIVYVDLI